MKLFAGEGVQTRTLQLVPGGPTEWEVHLVNGDTTLLVTPGCDKTIAERAIRLAEYPDLRGLTSLGAGGLGEVLGDGKVAYKKAFGGDLAGIGVGSLAVNEAIQIGLQQLPAADRTIGGATVAGVQTYAAAYPPQHLLDPEVCTPVWAMQQLHGDRPPAFADDDIDAHQDLLATAAVSQGMGRTSLYLDTYTSNYVLEPGGTMTKIDSGMYYPLDIEMSAMLGIKPITAR